MLKTIAAATAALAIAGSSIVYAQQRFDGPGEYDHGDMRFMHHHRLSIDDIKAFSDARIAALKAGLQLTPDQEKNWPPFEQALRDLVKLRLDRIKARESREAAGQQPPADPFTRMQNRAERLSQFSTVLKHVADAGAPLYQSLDDAQKNRFKMLAHALRPHWMRARFEHRWHGFGGDDDGHFGRHEGWHHGMMGPDRDDGGSGLMGHERGSDDADSL
jgi:hypothetical protein